MLLIDDVQFLEGKARTADEFFHTFNALYEGGAQLVLTADRVPGELSDLADRLRDRFEWGLTVPVEPPDLATRLVFLGNLAREQPERPAARRPAGARLQDLGQPARAQGSADPCRRPLLPDRLRRHPDSVERALPSDDDRRPQPPLSRTPARSRRPSPPASSSASTRILSPSRTAPVARARQLAMYLTRELTDLSLPAIAAGLQPPRPHHRPPRHPPGRARRPGGRAPLAGRRGAHLGAPFGAVDSGPDGS